MDPLRINARCCSMEEIDVSCCEYVTEKVSESVNLLLERTATHFELFKTELTAGEKSC